MRRIVDYEPALDIQNVDQLPRGLGARYLVVIDSLYPATYIAKAWKRVIPTSTRPGETIIRF